MTVKKCGITYEESGQVVIEYFILFAVITALTIAAISRLRGGGGFVASLQDMFRTVAERMAGNSP